MMPSVAGGLDLDSNLVASCRTCNATARGLVFGSFEEKRAYILGRRLLSQL